MAMEAMHYAKLHEINFASFFDVPDNKDQFKEAVYCDVWMRIGVICHLFESLPDTARSTALERISDTLPDRGAPMPIMAPPPTHVHVHLHGITAHAASDSPQPDDPSSAS